MSDGHGWGGGGWGNIVSTSIMGWGVVTSPEIYVLINNIGQTRQRQTSHLPEILRCFKTLTHTQPLNYKTGVVKEQLQLELKDLHFPRNCAYVCVSTELNCANKCQ